MWMFLDATGVRRSRRSAQPAGMVSSTPRKKGAAPGTTYLNAFTSTISSAVNGHPHQDAADKEAFVPKTSGDIFAPKRYRLDMLEHQASPARQPDDNGRVVAMAAAAAPHELGAVCSYRLASHVMIGPVRTGRHVRVFLAGLLQHARDGHGDHT